MCDGSRRAWAPGPAEQSACWFPRLAVAAPHRIRSNRDHRQSRTHFRCRCSSYCGGLARSHGKTYIDRILTLCLELGSVTEWQSADDRNNREKVTRARQAAEDLFKPTTRDPVPDATAA